MTARICMSGRRAVPHNVRWSSQARFGVAAAELPPSIDALAAQLGRYMTPTDHVE